MEKKYEKRRNAKQLNEATNENKYNGQSNMLDDISENQERETISSNDELFNTTKEYNGGRSNKQSNRDIKELVIVLFCYKNYI